MHSPQTVHALLQTVHVYSPCCMQIVHATAQNTFHWMNRRHTHAENDDKAGYLSSRVQMLKEISLEIGTELEYQNRLLNDMDDQATSAMDVLGNTMKRLMVMARTQTSSWMWLLLLFIIGVVAWIYLFRYR
ncbi:hypothetical protein EDD86DRAFT_210709 [Gorgonomyces haynaldii]|nr:hypothetical protein EDD86DRAFT_210709 [Gorgonomyces haynaldii]